MKTQILHDLTLRALNWFNLKKISINQTSSLKAFKKSIQALHLDHYEVVQKLLIKHPELSYMPLKNPYQNVEKGKATTLFELAIINNNYQVVQLILNTLKFKKINVENFLKLNHRVDKELVLLLSWHNKKELEKLDIFQLLIKYGARMPETNEKEWVSSFWTNNLIEEEKEKFFNYYKICLEKHSLNQVLASKKQIHKSKKIKI